jgi:hypothetical protein
MAVFFKFKIIRYFPVRHNQTSFKYGYMFQSKKTIIGANTTKTLRIR